VLGIARAHLVPASISVYAAWRLLKFVQSRRKPSPSPEEELTLPAAFDAVNSESATIELQQLQLGMLEHLVGQLLNSMLEDTLSVTLSTPFSSKSPESVREEMVLQVDTLRALYGDIAMDMLLLKLEKEQSWTKVLTEQAQLLDAGNPRLNFRQPKKMEDANQWTRMLQVGGGDGQ
jgi:hypothetical protein